AEAERQTEHPHRHRARARRRRKQIAEQRCRRGRARRLADADPEPRDDELREAARNARRRGQQAPDEDAARENAAADAAIRHPSERQSDHGVQEREDGAEQAERRVAERPLAPNSFADAADDLAVEEVHQVDREQDSERVRRSAHSGYFPLSMTAFAMRRRAEIASNGAGAAICSTASANGRSTARPDSVAETDRDALALRSA